MSETTIETTGYQVVGSAVEDEVMDLICLSELAENDPQAQADIEFIRDFIQVSLMRARELNQKQATP